MKAKTYSALQKTYDQSYLTCSTAAYYETQGNEVEALRCWRECLVQLQGYNAFTHRARSETEKALIRSLKSMREQCEERADFLEAILVSRKTAENNGAKGSSSSGLEPRPVRSDSQNSAGSVQQLVPQAPPQTLQSPPEIGESSNASNFHAIAIPHGIGVTPKGSRSPSPDKRGFLSTLRNNRKPRKTTGSPDTIQKDNPAAAAKAATLAWTSIGRADGGSLYHTITAPSSESLLIRPALNATSSTPELLSREQSFSSTGEQVTALALPKQSEKMRSKPRSHRSVLPQVEPSLRAPPPPPPPRRVPVQSILPNVNHSNTQPSEGDRAPPTPPPKLPPRPITKPQRLSKTRVSDHRRSFSDSSPTHFSDSESSPIYTKTGRISGHRNASNGSSKTPTNSFESEEITEEKDVVDDEDDAEEREWKERVKKVLKAVSKGVDQEAARQVANEIVVKGDEVHWEDVAGLEAAKLALKEAVVYPFLRPDLFSGLREPARGMLLFGPPGTGKTMLARAVATESKSTFFAISASSLTSKFLGESEKLVRALFALAKALAPSIIFVDEIDSLLSARSGSGEHEATRRIKTEFLIQWSELARAAAGKETTMGDPSRVLVLAATNLPWAIDEAARRRFVRRQYIPLPEAGTREKQLRTLLGHQKHHISDEEMWQLMDLTEGFSGSDITALAKDAAMGPLRSLGEALLHMKMEEIRPISFADFEASLTSIRPSVGKEGLRAYEQWAKQYGERVS